MRDSFNEKYYTLDLIPEYRREYIDLRIEWFIDAFELTDLDWPLDCVSLLQRMIDTQKISFTYGCFHLLDKYDALTEYIPSHDVYIMQINLNKINYPFEYSRDRRLNFTVAHEIGHIVLDHLQIPRHLKTHDQIAIEEHEANEFAGRLLMPEKMLYSCNFYSLDAVAQYFIVSKTAIWKRLNNIKKLDLLFSKKIPTCSQCGNHHFSMFSEYCSICGQPLRDDLKGVRRIYYPNVVTMDIYKRVIDCPKCGSKIDHKSYDKCTKCGTYIFNYCSNYLDESVDKCSYAGLGNALFCEQCGKPTYFSSKGFLKPWDNHKALPISERLIYVPTFTNEFVADQEETYDKAQSLL